jgi:DNA polymerase elongation subunit (family B)
MDFSPSLEITPANIEPNDAQKLLMKNMLNSFFGRFALHNNFNQHVICENVDDFNQLLSNPHYSIVDLVPHSDNVLEVEVMNHQMKVTPSRKGNLYITSEINALGRIFIYEKSEEIENRGGIILSMDTDSILFAWPKNTSLPFYFNESFGCFKHVLGNKTKITDFYSLGPRNYAVIYEENGAVKHVIKAKGLSLNAINCQKFLNVTQYADFINSFFIGEVKSVYIPQMRKKIDKQTKICHDVLTEFEFSNQIHVKRFILKNFKNHQFRTYPYGYDFSQMHDQLLIPKLKRKLSFQIGPTCNKKPRL